MIKRNGDNVFAIASSGNQCPARSAAAVSLCPGASPVVTRIPQPRAARMPPPADPEHNSKEANIALSTYVEKWKNKYEEADRKHKACLLKNEKARRDATELQRRCNIVTEERNHLEAELRERERELNKLRQVSEKLFAEYQQLKNQHEVDAGVMQKVMQQAGEWYKQNKQLKRRSTALLQALPPSAVDIDLTDSGDSVSDASTNEEIEFLKQTVSSLSRQVAELQTQLEAAQLQEFEAQQQLVTVTEELEIEREKTSSQETELQELRSRAERHDKLSKLLIEEVTKLKDNADKDRELAETYKSEARAAQKRVTVLTHQSSLLLGELTADERLLLLLQEVEALRAALEQQRARQHEQREQLQLKLAEKHEDTDILLWEEKIKLAEEDARKATERAEKAERRLAELANAKSGAKRSNLMSRISYFESGGTPESRSTRTEVTEKIAEVEEEVKMEEDVVEEEKVAVIEKSAPPVFHAPPPPPPPPPCLAPPPPPPPPAPPAFTPAAGGDMAALLASKQGKLKKTQVNNGGAIDAIVDQIKGGKFHLKSTDQNFLERRPREQPPEAVSEMLAILGTLRKRRSVSRPAFVGGGGE
ncbi:shootin-1 isoform X1 [Plutella xylostella]|uniref:shootin-1 isoform X1 n=1 Tax=Plutella xylostella TaxID=51655 RepID=UPI0020322539|nr:shootin-1 isoform X1 [Plutella xylostella]XP_048486534.1 shootin-1 isoform X1 [Plutella xylostella]